MFDPETRLLLACARKICQPETPEITHDTISGGIRWNLFLKKADDHRLIPFLPVALLPLEADIPADIRQVIRQTAMANLARHERMIQTLLQVSNLLEGGGVRALAYKGPVLSERSYGDAALRPYDDLDFLIHPADAMKAEEILTRNGFSLDLPLTPTQKTLHIRARRDWLFREKESGISVDINLATAPLYLRAGYSFDALFEKSELVRIGGKNIRTLGLEDTFLDLCVHGTKHRWCRLLWICDLARLIGSAMPPDWANLLSYARRLGCLRLLLTGVHAAQSLIDTPIPEILKESVRQDPHVPALVEQSALRFVMEPELSSEDTAAAILFQVRSRERIRDKIFYLLKRGLHPSTADWEFVRLPPAFYFFYYFIRPFRLAVQALRKAFIH